MSRASHLANPFRAHAFATAFALLTFAVSASLAQNPHVPDNVRIHGGYTMKALATGFDFPTSITTSSQGTWITEAGSIPGFVPKVKQISDSGSVSTILSADQLAAGQLLGPLTDVTYHDGWLWITHRQTGVNGWAVGAISKFRPDNPIATFTTVITNLPSAGDHYTEQIVFDNSGRAYFSQGTATNSTVVGADSWLLQGWLKKYPTFHDFPAKTITLSGISYKTQFPFPLDPTASDITTPFMQFDSGPVSSGTVVAAATPATPQDGMIAGNGTVYSFDPNAANPPSTLRLESWGFRNPYGIRIDPFHPGKLFITNNGADVRSMVVNGVVTPIGSRSIGDDYDDLYVADIGGVEQFFGFPDFIDDPKTGQPLPITDPLFCHEDSLNFPCPQFVFDTDFRNSLKVQPAFAEVGDHTSANKFDISTDPRFRFIGDLFIAETGGFVPITGATEFDGYKVVRVDRKTGEVTDFIVHTSPTPDVIFDPTGFNKPIDVLFRGDNMLVVDFGVYEPGLHLEQAGTGKVWVVAPISGESGR